MVGFPRPGYLRRRRTCPPKPLFTATEDQGKSTEAEKGGGGGLGDDAGLLELDSAELSKTIAAVAGLGGRAGRTVCIP